MSFFISYTSWINIAVTCSFFAQEWLVTCRIPLKLIEYKVSNGSALSRLQKDRTIFLIITKRSWPNIFLNTKNIFTFLIWKIFIDFLISCKFLRRLIYKIKSEIEKKLKHIRKSKKFVVISDFNKKSESKFAFKKIQELKN